MPFDNNIFGGQSYDSIILAMIDRKSSDFGRYRGVEITKDREIMVDTRDGGDNRECYGRDTSKDEDFKQCDPDPKKCCSGCVMTYIVPKYKYYKYDQNATYDGTYAEIYFEIPKKYLPLTDAFFSYYKSDDESVFEDPLVARLIKGLVKKLIS